MTYTNLPLRLCHTLLGEIDTLLKCTFLTSLICAIFVTNTNICLGNALSKFLFLPLPYPLLFVLPPLPLLNLTIILVKFLSTREKVWRLIVRVFNLLRTEEGERQGIHPPPDPPNFFPTSPLSLATSSSKVGPSNPRASIFPIDRKRLIP